MLDKEKISGEKLAKFFAYFYSPEGHKYLRLGQAFCIYFNIEDDLLFLEDDDKMATGLLARYCE